MWGANMKQKGFTLVEVMISLFIGGLILGGVMFTFISMKISTKAKVIVWNNIKYMYNKIECIN